MIQGKLSIAIQIIVNFYFKENIKSINFSKFNILIIKEFCNLSSLQYTKIVIIYVIYISVNF